MLVKSFPSMALDSFKAFSREGEARRSAASGIFFSTALAFSEFLIQD